MVDYKVFDRSKFTVVGNVDITDDGIASGFTANTRVRTLVQLSQLKGKSWEASAKAYIDTSVNPQHIVKFAYSYPQDLGVVRYNSATNAIRFAFSTGTSSANTNHFYDYVLETNYKGTIKPAIKFDITTGTYSCMIDNNIVHTYQATTANKELFVINEYPTENINLGYSWNAPSTIDLKEVLIIVDDKEIFSGTRNGNLVEKLQYLRDSKEIIRQSIEAKGVEVPIETPLRQYADKIGELSKIVQMTQVEYNELAEKDPNTLYVIVG